MAWHAWSGVDDPNTCAAMRILNGETVMICMEYMIQSHLRGSASCYEPVRGHCGDQCLDSIATHHEVDCLAWVMLHPSPSLRPSAIRPPPSACVSVRLRRPPFDRAKRRQACSGAAAAAPIPSRTDEGTASLYVPSGEWVSTRTTCWNYRCVWPLPLRVGAGGGR